MDPLILASMIFSLLVLGLIGGFILLYPLTRRLAEVLEKRYLGDGTGGANADQVAALRRAVKALRGEVERLGERQDFTERLLERPRSRDEDD